MIDFINFLSIKCSHPSTTKMSHGWIHHHIFQTFFMSLIYSFFLRNVLWTILGWRLRFIRSYHHGFSHLFRNLIIFWKMQSFYGLISHFTIIIFNAVVSLSFLTNSVLSYLYFSCFPHCSILFDFSCFAIGTFFPSSKFFFKVLFR